jgi:hypothetical protein
MAKRIQKAFRNRLRREVRAKSRLISDWDRLSVLRYHQMKCAYTLTTAAQVRTSNLRAKKLLQSFMFQALTGLQVQSCINRTMLQLLNIQQRFRNHVRRLAQKTRVVGHMWDLMAAKCLEAQKANNLLFIKTFEGQKFCKIEPWAKQICI